MKLDLDLDLESKSTGAFHWTTRFFGAEGLVTSLEYSKLPMSHPAPCGRATPRLSVEK